MRVVKFNPCESTRLIIREMLVFWEKMYSKFNDLFGVVHAGATNYENWNR